MASLFTDFYDRFQLSVRLENKSSVARDHLANERTFLAWLRTSLTFASAGVAMTQLFRLSALNKGSFTYHVSTVIGSLFVAMGIAIMAMGTIRYYHVQSVLQTGFFPAARAAIFLAFGVSFSLIIVALALLIQVSRTNSGAN